MIVYKILLTVFKVDLRLHLFSICISRNHIRHGYTILVLVYVRVRLSPEAHRSFYKKCTQFPEVQNDKFDPIVMLTTSLYYRLATYRYTIETISLHRQYIYIYI